MQAQGDLRDQQVHPAERDRWDHRDLLDQMDHRDHRSVVLYIHPITTPMHWFDLFNSFDRVIKDTPGLKVHLEHREMMALMDIREKMEKLANQVWT